MGGTGRFFAGTDHLETSTRSGAAIIAALALGFGLALAPISPAVGSPAALAALFDDGIANPLIVLDADYNVIQSDPGLMVPLGAAMTLDLNGKQLNVVRDGNYAGIRVPPTSSLTIRGAGATGGLTVTGGAAGAGIGGDFDEGAGTIIINTPVTAIGGWIYGAGIGGGANGDGCTVIIDVPDGVVTATGGAYAAGIGGGSNGHGGVTTIRSGKVTATGGQDGAGIGGGLGGAVGGNGELTTIEGGVVTATGGRNAAGIGGGNGGNGGTIVISAGPGHGALDSVTARGGGTGGGAGIGGGSGGDGGSVTISAYQVNAYGGLTGAAIGGGSGGKGGDVAIGALAEVTVDGRHTVIGEGIASSSDPAAMDPLRFGSLINAGTLNVRGGSALLFPAGVTLANSGVFAVQNTGRVSNAGTVMNSGTVSVDGTFVNSGAIVNTGTGEVETPDWSKVTVNHYLVGFDPTGGVVADPSIRVFAESFDVAQLSLPVPTRTGHSFRNWHSDAAGTSAALTTSTILGAGNGPVPVDFYAAWTVNVHTITYDSQGGSSVAPVTADYGTNLAEPAEPTRAAHVFTGWFTAASGGVAWNFADAITTDLTLYAGWTPTASPPGPGGGGTTPPGGGTTPPGGGTTPPEDGTAPPGGSTTTTAVNTERGLARTGAGNGLLPLLATGAGMAILGALLMVGQRKNTPRDT